MPVSLLALFYAGGYLAQVMGSYALWKQGGGYPGDGTFPPLPSPAPLPCLYAAFRPPYGIYGVLVCTGILILLLFMVMRIGCSDEGEHDGDWNFTYSSRSAYGTSGWMNRILQGVSCRESLIICDPKSELYEKASGYLRDKGYTVRMFNLVNSENSDSWNCLCEIEGQELMAQLFVDVIIKNTTAGGKGDHFWDSAEMNLLKALVLYVDKGYPAENAI